MDKHTPTPLDISINGGESDDEYWLEIPVKGNAIDAEILLHKIVRACNAHDDLVKIAQAYRNLLKTMAITEGEVATFHHIEDVLSKAEGK